MTRFKPIDSGLKLLPIDLERQLIPGTFEYALHYLIDHKLDLSELESRFKNDDQGAFASALASCVALPPASMQSYAPSVLLKILLLAYSRSIIGSRRIEQACRENVVFMAISGDSLPHFTTLAAFVSTLGDQAAKLFAQVWVTCGRQGLRNTRSTATRAKS